MMCDRDFGSVGLVGVSGLGTGLRADGGPLLLMADLLEEVAAGDVPDVQLLRHIKPVS